jgi:hypothetical protein
MLTMSRALSAGKALDYYKQEFTNSKDNYYSEAGEVKAIGVAPWPRNGTLKARSLASSTSA